MKQRILAVGHPHVSATHATTFEVTTDDYLTPSGDCILAVEADRAPADFDPAFVQACRDAAASIRATVMVGDRRVTVEGRGHPDLSFASERGAVVRTSDHVDDRTVLVEANTAAADLPRPLVSALADGASLELVLAVDR